MFTLKFIPELGAEILQLDDKTLFCPYKNSLLIPGAIQGQINIHREPCGTQCALFEKIQGAVIQHCNSREITLTNKTKIAL